MQTKFRKGEIMKIGLFAVASLIYGVLIAIICIFYLDFKIYHLTFNENTIELPMVVLILMPLAIYFILTLLHIAFYNFLNHLKFKHFFKDAKKFEDFVKDLLLEKDPKISFKTKEFKQVGELSKSLKTGQKIPNYTKINDVLELLDSLKKGEFLNLNQFKLNAHNALFLQNKKNRLQNDLHYAYDKLKNLHQINNELEEIAFKILLEKGTYEQIKNIKIVKTPAQILNLIERFKKKSLELSLAEFEVLISQIKFDEKEYLILAKMSAELFNPDAILNIFLKIKNENDEALRAYLYLLAEFSMFEELESQIRNDNETFLLFKAVLILREKHIKIDLKHFIQ